MGVIGRDEGGNTVPARLFHRAMDRAVDAEMQLGKQDAELDALRQQLAGAVEDAKRLREALDWIYAEPEDALKVQMWARAALDGKPFGGR